MNAIEKFQLKQAMTEELVKQAKKDDGTAANYAGLGGALGGPLGAALGGYVGRKRGQAKGERYHGSPGLRAAGGAFLGAVPMALVAGAAQRAGHAPAAMLARLGAVLGGGAGGYLGARSAYSGKAGKVKKASPATGAAIGGALGGFPGAMIGAKLGKKKGEQYKGSPVLRAGGGAILGGVAGNLASEMVAPGAKAAIRQTIAKNMFDEMAAGKSKTLGEAYLRIMKKSIPEFAKKRPLAMAAMMTLPMAGTALGAHMGAKSAKPVK